MSSLKDSLLGESSNEGVSIGNQKSPLFKVTWALIMLGSGTFTTLFAKALYETHGEGSISCNYDDDADKNCSFDKPWFTVLLMKLSMSLCLVIYYGFGWGKDNPDLPDPSWKTIKAVALPAFLDLLNTVLGNVGLLWVNSSIYQMTKGSVVVFSAMLSVRWLGRKLRSFHYYSIALVIVAIILVGTAGILQNQDDSQDVGMTLVGLAFILAAQGVTAVQFTVEERLMTDSSTALDPVALVGFEGLWGVLMFVVLAPILTFTPRSGLDISIVWHEDFGDTFTKLSNSSDLCLLSFGYSVAIFFYNVAANFVTQCLSSVVRSILEACRVMGVWFVGLMFFYLGTTSQSKIGEEWSNWSFLQLFGFMILLYGTFSYKALLKMPCVTAEIYELAIRDEEDFVIKSKLDEKFGPIDS